MARMKGTAAEACPRDLRRGELVAVAKSTGLSLGCVDLGRRTWWRATTSGAVR
jgi:hypothetical protein